MRVAVASSGLGYINRGVEAWALDLAAALRGVGGVNVTLFQASGVEDEWTQSVWCLPRTRRLVQLLGRLLRRLGGWRCGVGNDYEVEQASFSLALWPRICRGFDILHVQDPTIALIFDRLHRAGLSRARVILGNGTETPPLILRRLSTVQQLSPLASAQWEAHRPPAQRVFTIPNFIDTGTFRPGDKAAARRALGLPTDALIVLSCAALRRTHKRIDYMIREFASFLHQYDGDALLLLAGGRESETEELVRLGTSQLGRHVRFFVDHPRRGMPDLYRAADLFAMSSLYEAFGIVLIEAMATGLPVVCHDAPSFRNLVGSAGLFGDLTQEGVLSRLIGELAPAARRKPLTLVARGRAESGFSVPVVIEQILAMYRDVVGAAQPMPLRPALP